VKEYRVKATVQAERVEENSRVMTNAGVQEVNSGDYMVYLNGGGTIIVQGDVFDEMYAEVKGDSEFHPAGNTVEQVLEFLADNPDQLDRVKQEERDGGNRKGILSYEVG
jgi:hypothetical protein